MQPAKLSVCLGFIALCFATVVMVTAPFIEKRRGWKCFLTRHGDCPAARGASTLAATGQTAELIEPGVAAR